MRGFFITQNKNSFYRGLCGLLTLVLSISLVLTPSAGYAQSINLLNLPIPGTMLAPSPAFVPVLLKGMTVHPEDPFQFDFIIDSGNTEFSSDQVKEESERLVKYFLASMTVPKDDLWVNLSPYENDRIVPEELGKTELGRDMLAQDYILKQLTASLMYPEEELGKKFWDRVYKKAEEQFGTTEIPVNTFNKVWILPDAATVYEHEQTVYIIDAHLKVMLDSDYMAMDFQQKSTAKSRASAKGMAMQDESLELQSSIIKEIIIPEIEREVNQGEHFAPLRQIYHSLILAKWYKETVKNSLLSQTYVDQNKISGVDVEDPTIKDQIYAQYMEAYKKGVFNYIKEDYDDLSNEVIPRKYFSGGLRIGAGEIYHSSSPVIIGDGIEGEGYEAHVTVGMQKDGASSPILLKRPWTLRGARRILDDSMTYDDGKVTRAITLLRREGGSDDFTKIKAGFPWTLEESRKIVYDTRDYTEEKIERAIQIIMKKGNSSELVALKRQGYIEWIKLQVKYKSVSASMESGVGGVYNGTEGFGQSKWVVPGSSEDAEFRRKYIGEIGKDGDQNWMVYSVIEDGVRWEKEGVVPSKYSSSQASSPIFSRNKLKALYNKELVLGFPFEQEYALVYGKGIFVAPLGSRDPKTAQHLSVLLDSQLVDGQYVIVGSFDEGPIAIMKLGFFSDPQEAEQNFAIITQNQMSLNEGNFITSLSQDRVMISEVWTMASWMTEERWHQVMNDFAGMAGRLTSFKSVMPRIKTDHIDVSKNGMDGQIRIKIGRKLSSSPIIMGDGIEGEGYEAHVTVGMQKDGSSSPITIPGTLSWHRKRLKDENPDIRIKSIKVLEKKDNAEDIKLIIGMVKDNDRGVAVVARASLLKIAKGLRYPFDKEVLSALLELKIYNEEIYGAFLDYLKRYTPQVIATSSHEWSTGPAPEEGSSAWTWHNETFREAVGMFKEIIILNNSKNALQKLRDIYKEMPEEIVGSDYQEISGASDINGLTWKDSAIVKRNLKNQDKIHLGMVISEIERTLDGNDQQELKVVDAETARPISLMLRNFLRRRKVRKEIEEKIGPEGYVFIKRKHVDAAIKIIDSGHKFEASFQKEKGRWEYVETGYWVRGGDMYGKKKMPQDMEPFFVSKPKKSRWKVLDYGTIKIVKGEKLDQSEAQTTDAENTQASSPILARLYLRKLMKGETLDSEVKETVLKNIDFLKKIFEENVAKERKVRLTYIIKGWDYVRHYEEAPLEYIFIGNKSLDEAGLYDGEAGTNYVGGMISVRDYWDLVEYELAFRSVNEEKLFDFLLSLNPSNVLERIDLLKQENQGEELHQSSSPILARFYLQKLMKGETLDSEVKKIVLKNIAFLKEVFEENVVKKRTVRFTFKDGGWGRPGHYEEAPLEYIFIGNKSLDEAGFHDGKTGTNYVGGMPSPDDYWDFVEYELAFRSVNKEKLSDFLLSLNPANVLERINLLKQENQGEKLDRSEAQTMDDETTQSSSPISEDVEGEKFGSSAELEFRLFERFARKMTFQQAQNIRSKVKVAIEEIGIDNIKNMHFREFGRKLAEHFNIGFIDAADEQDYILNRNPLNRAGIMSADEFKRKFKNSGRMISVKEDEGAARKRLSWMNELLSEGNLDAYVLINSSIDDGLDNYLGILREFVEFLVADVGAIDDYFLDAYGYNSVIVLEQELNFALQMGKFWEAWAFRSRVPDNLSMLEDPEGYYEMFVEEIEVFSIVNGEQIDKLTGDQRSNIYQERDSNKSSSPILSKEEVGGIDLNEIDVDHQGAGVDIQFDPIEIQDILNMDFDGLAPVIINLTPLPSVLPLLGLAPRREEEEFELSSVSG